MIRRQNVGKLTLSAAGIATLFAAEGFVTEPMLPNPHDRPTICYGNTFYEDGTPVRLTDEPVTEERCLQIAAAHLKKDEDKFKASIKDVALTQTEFDVYSNFVYQYGHSTWTRSSMVRHLKAGRHADACRALLLYKNITIRQNGKPVLYDCSTPNNRICRGVWTRQLERYTQCMSVQSMIATGLSESETSM